MQGKNGLSMIVSHWQMRLLFEKEVQVCWTLAFTSPALTALSTAFTVDLEDDVLRNIEKKGES